MGDKGIWSCARSKAVSQLILEEAQHNVRFAECRTIPWTLSSSTHPRHLPTPCHNMSTLKTLLHHQLSMGRKQRYLWGRNCGTPWSMLQMLLFAHLDRNFKVSDFTPRQAVRRWRQKSTDRSFVVPFKSVNLLSQLTDFLIV